MRSSLIVLALVLSAAPACTRVVDTDLGYGDTLASAGAGDIQDTVRVANEVRESSVVFFFLERWLNLENYGEYILVEAINEQDELHRFLLVARTSSGYELVTNIGLPPIATGPDAPLPGDVLVYSVNASPERDRWYTLASQSVPPGVGGIAEVDDGDSHFLTRSASGAVGKSVLYGVSFAPLDDDPDRPADADDIRRYEAIDAVYGFWNDALAAAPAPEAVITTTP